MAELTQEILMEFAHKCEYEGGLFETLLNYYSECPAEFEGTEVGRLMTEFNEAADALECSLEELYIQHGLTVDGLEIDEDDES